MKFSHPSILLFAFSFLLLVGCNSTKKVTEESVPVTYSENVNYVMTILLEFFNRAEEPVKMYDTITKEGYLKNGNENDVNQTHRYMTVVEFSDNTPKIKRTFPDPLNKVVEFVDANGNLGKKEVSLDSEVVPIRMNYNTAVKDLKVYVQEDSNWSLIATFPLNQ